MKTIKEIIKWADNLLKENNINNSFFEARSLLEKVLDKKKEWIMINYDASIDDENFKIFEDMIQRRLKGEPLQYILGYEDFMRGRFFVNQDVLIPREDTEILVENICKQIKDIKKPKILDMCTGSGCIAISLKTMMPGAIVFASDISEAALEITRKNAKLNGTEIFTLKSDLFSDINDYNFDLICANPPYIKTDEIDSLQVEVRQEPRLALDGGKDGLNFYRKIVSEAKNYLKADGYLFLEIGYDQADAVGEFLDLQGYREIICIIDYSGNNRVMVGKV